MAERPDWHMSSRKNEGSGTVDGETVMGSFDKIAEKVRASDSSAGMGGLAGPRGSSYMPFAPPLHRLVWSLAPALSGIPRELELEW